MYIPLLTSPVPLCLSSLCSVLAPGCSISVFVAVFLSLSVCFSICLAPSIFFSLPLYLSLPFCLSLPLSASVGSLPLCLCLFISCPVPSTQTSSPDTHLCLFAISYPETEDKVSFMDFLFGDLCVFVGRPGAFQGKEIQINPQSLEFSHNPGHAAMSLERPGLEQLICGTCPQWVQDSISYTACLRWPSICQFYSQTYRSLQRLNLSARELIPCTHSSWLNHSLLRSLATHFLVVHEPELGQPDHLSQPASLALFSPPHPPNLHHFLVAICFSTLRAHIAQWFGMGTVTLLCSNHCFAIFQVSNCISVSTSVKWRW